MKTVCAYSGGLDSTVLLFDQMAAEHEVLAVTVDYGQRHKVEIEHAKQITSDYGIRHIVCDLSGFAIYGGSGSSQTDSAVQVPEGHYSSENMAVTVVPNRNMILLALAAAVAVANDSNCIAYAAHAGDHAVYPDCRPQFVNAMREALGFCSEPGLILTAPFLGMTKADIVRHGDELLVPFADTWSCYRGGSEHCGRCSTCVERAEAFAIAGVKDPTSYTDAEYWKSVVMNA
jgi:7-cyano-7-deazaguanine synthase